MSVTVEIRPARGSDAALLAANLRPGDRRELALLGIEPETVIDHCITSSLYAKAALFDGELAALWGVSTEDMTSELGNLWLLTADPIERLPHRFARECRNEIKAAHAIWPRLFIQVDPFYRRAVRLLTVMGFARATTIVPGPLGSCFHIYERSA